MALIRIALIASIAGAPTAMPLEHCANCVFAEFSESSDCGGSDRDSCCNQCEEEGQSCVGLSFQAGFTSPQLGAGDLKLCAPFQCESCPKAHATEPQNVPGSWVCDSGPPTSTEISGNLTIMNPEGFYLQVAPSRHPGYRHLSWVKNQGPVNRCDHGGFGMCWQWNGKDNTIRHVMIDSAGNLDLSLCLGVGGNANHPDLVSCDLADQTFKFTFCGGMTPHTKGHLRKQDSTTPKCLGKEPEIGAGDGHFNLSWYDCPDGGAAPPSDFLLSFAPLVNATDGARAHYQKNNTLPRLLNGQWQRPEAKIKLGCIGRCHAEARVKLHGDEMPGSTLTVNSVGECCDTCATIETCVAWVLDGNRCILLSATSSGWDFCEHCFSGNKLVAAVTVV